MTKYDHMKRHILTHSDQVKSKFRAKRLADKATLEAKARYLSRATKNVLSRSRGLQIFGPIFKTTNFRAKLKEALKDVDAKLEGGSDSDSTNEDDVGSNDDEEVASPSLATTQNGSNHQKSAKSTKRLVQDNLGDKDYDTEVYRLYGDLMTSAKNERTASIRKENLARYLAFAKKRKPGVKCDWDYVVDQDVGRDFLYSVQPKVSIRVDGATELGTKISQSEAAAANVRVMPEPAGTQV